MFYSVYKPIKVSWQELTIEGATKAWGFKSGKFCIVVKLVPARGCWVAQGRFGGEVIEEREFAGPEAAKYWCQEWLRRPGL